MSAHPCPVPGCTVTNLPAHNALCPNHYFKLDRSKRFLLNRAYDRYHNRRTMDEAETQRLYDDYQTAIQEAVKEITR